MYVYIYIIYPNTSIKRIQKRTEISDHRWSATRLLHRRCDQLRVNLQQLHLQPPAGGVKTWWNRYLSHVHQWYYVILCYIYFNSITYPKIILWILCVITYIIFSVVSFSLCIWFFRADKIATTQMTNINGTIAKRFFGPPTKTGMRMWFELESVEFVSCL